MSETELTHWNEIEKKFHEPARLALVTALCSCPKGLGFQDLKSQCGLTDGNLSRHLKVLEEAGIVQQHKFGKGRRSRTLVILTPAGRGEFMDYLQALERVLHGAIEALEPGSDRISFPALAVS